MTYYIDTFSPATYDAFSKTNKDVTGVREAHASYADKLRPGDKLICYVTKVGRWVGVLEVASGVFRDGTPRFSEVEDPFVVRIRVKPIAWLEIEKGVPIREDVVWNTLTMTKGHSRAGSRWTGPFRSSLNRLADDDATFLEDLILSQLDGGTTYPIDEEEYRTYVTQQVRGAGKAVDVSIPDDTVPAKEEVRDETEVRESIKIQALLAKVGEKMGFKVWIPKNDQAGVLQEWTPSANSLLDLLPLNYNQATIKTIEQIDVLWIKRSSIVRAFEVEHTTSIYSGILRMADLLALQPNMDIKLHLVAPDQRRHKVFQEIQRPVFSLLERGPLSDYCTFISYDSLRDLAQERNLAFLTDKVIENYEEIVE